MVRRILVVDDELHIVRAAEFKLKKLGYDVCCAADGEEAWNRIQEQLPDLVVSDYQMPRLNGLELVQRIREHEGTAHLPVILLTAKGYELAQQEPCDHLGLYSIIPKPFSPRELCNQVAQALEGASPPVTPAN